jgi:hypothetical protein
MVAAPRHGVRGQLTRGLGAWLAAGVEGWGEKSVVGRRRLMEGGKVLFELTYVETRRLIFSLTGF